DEAPLLIAALSPPPREADWYTTTPNPLSAEIIGYPLIERIHESTKLANPPVAVTGYASDVPFNTVVRRRRSALDFEGGDRTISLAQFETLVACALRRTQYVTLYAYVHRVDGLEPGVYRCGRESLHLLLKGDQKVVAAGLSLQQQLAGNSCVTFSMVADLERATGQWGGRGYRYCFFEAGAIGQRLYVAAEALGFQSTGIGAFFDDAVHQYLNLKPEDGQVIYHFASGYAVKDRRITEE
ncbi:MAG: SagB/ThcOx family dehydrogenase, partial [Bryobacterales bacterium]|nr:SagB/ThcOx family dehydrogenase [Bryobacterales bacterium]